MPFHHAPFRAAPSVRACIFPLRIQWLSQRPFSTSPLLRGDIDSSTNHYETLDIPTDASQADIKKSFYSLSKQHHPDHSSHPKASARFQRINEAYHVLGHADKRARYDRDHMRLGSSSQHHAARRAGSYSSTSGPAGGRPASGLSRRRGTFTGPPPSFFRSGGWGAHGAKRRASHEETTGTGPSGAGMGERGGGGGSTASRAGGMGPGQDPTHATGGAAHFDHVGHERMHRRYDEARRARRRGDEGVPYVDTGLWLRFVVVTGIVAGCAYVPYWFAKDGSKKKQRAV